MKSLTTISRVIFLYKKLKKERTAASGVIWQQMVSKMKKEKEIKVNQFLSEAACKTRVVLEKRALTQKSIDSIIMRAIAFMCDAMKNNKSRTALKRELLEFFTKEFSKLSFFLPWQEKQTVNYVTSLFERFLDWFQFGIKKMESNLEVKAAGFKTICHLLVQYTDNSWEAFYFQRKNYQQMSCKAKRQEHTIENNLQLLVIKLALMEKYSELRVSCICLENTDDNGVTIAPFSKSSLMNSNVFSTSFANLNTFDLQKMIEVSKAIALEQKTDCRICKYHDICFAPKLEPTQLGQAEQKILGYQLPEFTASQKEAIMKKEGQLVILAGPGSGKTAVIVGRALELMKSGIYPPQILLLTFTRKAAEEIKSRIRMIVGEEEKIPTVLTINALGYEIIRENKRLLKRNKLLTEIEKGRLITTILSISPIEGFSYEPLYGEYGAVHRFLRYSEQIDLHGEDFFCERSPEELNISQFLRTKELYDEYISVGGYLSFDEQVSICNDLFRNHPEILEKYKKQYPYIMADEYQDINESHARFIYQLAGEKGNLCVVGDDDQSIYQFRGGSAEYILDFVKKYPNAQTIVLEDNFRSTKEIITAAASVIKNSSEKRWKKEIKASKRGLIPRKITGDIRSIEAEVKLLRNQGIAYQDIAILAIQNATLEKIYQEANFPVSLAKAYLRQDVIFLILKDVLSMYYQGYRGRHSITLFHYLKMFSEDIMDLPHTKEDLMDDLMEEYHLSILEDYSFYDALEESNDTLAIAMGLASMLFRFLDTGIAAICFLEHFSMMLGLQQHRTIKTVEEIIEQESLSSCEDLFSYLNDMELFSDSSRLEFDAKNSVTLSTCHDAKGKEWKAVIIYGLQNFEVPEYKKMTAEARKREENEKIRLLYVSMTRAKEYLIMISSIR